MDEGAGGTPLDPWVMTGVPKIQALKKSFKGDNAFETRGVKRGVGRTQKEVLAPTPRHLS